MEYITSVIAIALICYFVLTRKLYLKVRMQFLLMLLISVEVAIFVDLNLGLAILIFEVLNWIALRNRVPEKKVLEKADSLLVINRKLLLVTAMTIASSLILVIGKDLLFKDKAHNLLVESSNQYIVFVMLLMIFVGSFVREKNE